MSTIKTQDATLSRRELLRYAAAGAVTLAVPEAALSATKAKQALDPKAGAWQTWLVPSTALYRPAAPPKKNSAQARAELVEVQGLQAALTADQRALIDFWDLQAGITQWSQILLEKVRENATDPVKTSRAMALLHTAIADAVTVAWSAKFTYKRVNPAKTHRSVKLLSAVQPTLPSYVSEHAAVAGAAAAVLNYLYPSQQATILGNPMTFDEAANTAAASRIWAGAAFRSDVEAGLLVGQAIGFLAVDRGVTDGSSAVWDPVAQPGRPIGPQYWQPTAPGFVFPPLYPYAGRWNPWLLTAGDQFRPPVPPALQGSFPNAQFRAEALEVKQIGENLTNQQRQIALFWNDGAGSYTPPGHWMTTAIERTAQSGISAPRAARALALFAVGMADSAIACWDSKYAYWTVRPITAIQTMAGQSFYNPAWSSLITTPPFPTYVSGHSTFSGCASEILEYLFPGKKAQDAFGIQVPFRAAAEQAAVSRLYGGIHYRSDNDQGLVLGRKVAELVVRRAHTDGSGQASS